MSWKDFQIPWVIGLSLSTLPSKEDVITGTWQCMEFIYVSDVIFPSCLTNSSLLALAREMTALHLRRTVLSVSQYWFSLCVKLLGNGRSHRITGIEWHSKWHSSLPPVDMIWPCRFGMDIVGDTTALYPRQRPVKNINGGTLFITASVTYFVLVSQNLIEDASQWAQASFRLRFRPHTASVSLVC